MLLAGCVQGEDAPAGSNDGAKTVALRLDYAYYNPASLVLREQKWLETELAGKGVTVSWQLSAGSNKANEALRAAQRLALARTAALSTIRPA